MNRKPSVLQLAVNANGRRAAKLAIQIWNNASFNLLPVLADVLEEVGVEDPFMLLHFRDRNYIHDRGCSDLFEVLHAAGLSERESKSLQEQMTNLSSAIINAKPWKLTLRG